MPLQTHESAVVQAPYSPAPSAAASRASANLALASTDPALGELGEADAGDRVGQRGGVAVGVVAGRLPVRAGRWDVVHREAGCGRGQLGLGAQHAGLAELQRRLRQPAAQRVVPAQPPVHPQRPAQPTRRLAVPALEQRLHRGREVQVLGVDPGQRRHLPAVPVARGQLLGDAQEVVGVSAGRRLFLARLGQPGPRVLRHRLQQPVSVAVRAALDRHQRLLGQRLQRGQHVPREVGPPGDTLDVVEPETSDEYRQQPEQRLLLLRQEAVAPVERRPHGAVPLRPVGTFGLQHLVEPFEEHRRREQPASGGRQLERQRDPGQADADRLDRLGVTRRGAPAGGDVRRPFEQQADGRCLAGTRLGEREGLDRELVLGPQPQRCPAGDEQRQTRDAGDQVGDPRRRRGDLLGVVEDQQQLTAGGPRDQGGDRVLPRCGRRAYRVQDGRHDPGGVVERRQLDVHDAVGEPVLHGAGHGQREAGLADTAGAGQRHHAVELQQPDHLPEVVFAADQPGGRHRDPRAGAGRRGWACSAAARGDRGDQVRARVTLEAERVGQSADGVRVGPRAGAALEGADRMAAHAGPLGELLLGQPARLPQPPQTHPERPLVVTHALSLRAPGAGSVRRTRRPLTGSTRWTSTRSGGSSPTTGSSCCPRPRRPRRTSCRCRRSSASAPPPPGSPRR